MKLPAASDLAAYQRSFNDEVWEAAALMICARHKIAHHTLRRSPQGENIIFFVNESVVIKIFAPFRENFLRETRALEFAHGKLGIATPELLHTGEIEGWSYLLMTTLPGEASRELWETIARPDRLAIVEHLGSAMRELHAHAALPLKGSALDRDWPAFIERQAKEAVARQRACGANAEWIESLPAYIESRMGLLATGDAEVFLHGDIHAGNVLLSEKGGRWRITGLLDFGDSLCGHSEYEFVAPGVLMTQGDGELQRALLLAYGYTASALDANLRARLMLLTVLYECSDLRKYALRLAPEAVHLKLDELERAIWAFVA